MITQVPSPSPGARIVLEVTHPVLSPGRIQGFRYVWAFYVEGYDPATHCQPCFKGARVPEFCTPTAQTGRRVVLDRMNRYPYVYVCGVGVGPKPERWRQNLHMPLRYCEGSVVERESYNGYVFRAEDAEEIAIPPLPDDWQGLPREHARCKNFQFAVACFGYPPRP